MTDIKGVLFDKDGTLLDVMATWYPVYREVLGEFFDGDEDRIAAALVAGGYQPDVHNFAAGSMLAAGTPDQMVDIWWPELTGEARERRIVEADTLCTEKGLKFASELMPLQPLFAQLKEAGLLVGIATNDGTRSAEMQMHQLEVADQLDFIVGFDGVENPKPAGDMVHAFCAQTGLAVENVMVVGDNSHDMEMARNAGNCYAVAVLSGNSGHDDIHHLADVVLASAADLPNHLQSLKN